MRRFALLGILIAGAGGAWWLMAGPKAAAPKADSKPTGADRAIGRQWIVGAGRVEPASEEIEIGSELDGRLRGVLVDEGQSVVRGQLIAELENSDFAARVQLAAATVREREASLDRLRNGSRAGERRESEANAREAEAVLANAESERNRRQTLLDRGAISRSEFELADREVRVARARVDSLRERMALVQDQTRPEDVRRAEADVAHARAQVAEAQATLAKTAIRAPISGLILRKRHKTGESVSASADPIVTLGDCSRLRVRVDVDENDVARLTLGQSAWVTASAYGEQKFTGKVVKIGSALGRKNVRTDEPTERADLKILETLVELDAGQKLPVGLRVDAFIDFHNKAPQ